LTQVFYFAFSTPSEDKKDEKAKVAVGNKNDKKVLLQDSDDGDDSDIIEEDSKVIKKIEGKIDRQIDWNIDEDKDSDRDKNPSKGIGKTSTMAITGQINPMTNGTQKTIAPT
jgi:hypothetical protein